MQNFIRNKNDPSDQHCPAHGPASSRPTRDSPELSQYVGLAELDDGARGVDAEPRHVLHRVDVVDDRRLGRLDGPVDHDLGHVDHARHGLTRRIEDLHRFVLDLRYWVTRCLERLWDFYCVAGHFGFFIVGTSTVVVIFRSG